jgi:hypothetical protein
MTIEDVDFLKQNAFKQNYMFLVDSADRNRIVDPTPSEYTVNFDIPFKNVISLEVVEASIPRTLYNIDKYNNQISFLIHDDTVNPINLESYCNVELEPGDYTIQTLIPELNNKLQMHLNNSSDEIVTIKALSLSNPPEVKNIIQFYSAYKFSFDMKSSTIAETLGFDTYIEKSEESVIEENRRYNGLIIDNEQSNIYNFKIYHSVDRENVLFDLSKYDIYTGPRSVIRKLELSDTSKVAQSFYVKEKCKITEISIAGTTFTREIGGKIYWEIYNNENFINTNRIGNGELVLEYTDGTYTIDIVTNPIEVNVGVNWIVFYGDIVTNENLQTFIFYNDISEYISNNVMKTKSGDNDWENIDNNGIHYETSIILTVKYNYHRIIAPGLLSLIGDRYIVLRCPEIEDIAVSSLSYTKHSLGLAKFRLGVVGYSENDLSYIKVPVREFHPIGKLSKMTLRFERSDGTLYDFKGVNHTITFAIYYYEVKHKTEFKRSILNPNYTGDFLSYMKNQEEQEEDSDDQEYEYNRDNPEISFKVNESYHLPDNIINKDMNAIYSLNIQEDYDEDEDEDEDDE